MLLLIGPSPCRIRDLNDEINKLIREKGHWEKRIVELGGPDYSKVGPKVTDSEGRAVAEASSGRGPGYRYFGAAKQLPGVRELFEKDAPRQVRTVRAGLGGLCCSGQPAAAAGMHACRGMHERGCIRGGSQPV